MDRAIEDMAVQRDTATKLYQEAALGNSQPETSGHVVMTKHNMQRMLEDGLKATDFGQSVGPDAVSHFYEFTLSSNLRGLNILPKYFEMAVGDVLLPREMAAHVHADSGRPLTLFHREDGSLEITTDQPLARLGWFAIVSINCVHGCRKEAVVVMVFSTGQINCLAGMVMASAGF